MLLEHSLVSHSGDSAVVDSVLCKSDQFFLAVSWICEVVRPTLVTKCACFCVLSREGNEKSYQLLRDSLDFYLTINPDNVQYLLLQARLYFHLGIWPEKVSSVSQMRLIAQNTKWLWFMSHITLMPNTQQVYKEGICCICIEYLAWWILQLNHKIQIV